MIHSNKPQLSFEIGGNHLHTILRVDQIRTNTLMQLVQRWADPQARDETLDALDKLAAVVASPAREGELDAAVEQVEDVACMDTAQVEVDVFDTRRMLAELTEVCRVVGRFNPQGAKGASEIKHPGMRATRQHFVENPMPRQQDRRWSA